MDSRSVDLFTRWNVIINCGLDSSFIEKAIHIRVRKLVDTSWLQQYTDVGKGPPRDNNFPSFW